MELTAETPRRAYAEPQFDWQPDTERLGREVRSAELKGRRDDLTLAEIECSLDLVDAELAALRRQAGRNAGPGSKLQDLITVRGRLSALAGRLQRLPA